MINKRDYLNAIYQDIDIVKGDTLGFNFELQGLAGETPDAITFSCAEHYDNEPLFIHDLSDGIDLIDYDATTDTALYSIRVAPESTKDLHLGKYYYDLQLNVNDDVITLMRGRLTLLYEVTRG